MTILQENHHSFLIVEHDPLLYEDAEKRMVEYLAQALKQTSREATVLLYAPALDPHLQKMAGLANPGVLHLQRAGPDQRPREGRGEDAGRTGYSGGVLVRWRWTSTGVPLNLRSFLQSPRDFQTKSFKKKCIRNALVHRWANTIRSCT